MLMLSAFNAVIGVVPVAESWAFAAPIPIASTRIVRTIFMDFMLMLLILFACHFFTDY
jgi:hypothetical protein